MSKPLPERFWEKVGEPDPETGCLPWTASRDSKGYGHIRYGNRMHRAHRVAWLLAYDEWPKQTLDHLCRNRVCVNIAHLEDVPLAENVRRGDPGKHWRDRTHCSRGHEYTPENTHTRSSGKRQCRECKNDSNRAYKARKRQETDRD